MKNDPNVPNIPHWLPGVLVAAFIIGGAVLLLSGCASSSWGTL